MGVSCGLWLSRRTLWASIVDGDGKHLASFPAARTDAARCNLLAHVSEHHGLDCSLVLTDAHARIDNVANLALERDMSVWLAPWRSVHAVRVITGMATGPPRRTAIALARMQLHPLFRAQLRKLERDRRQLTLL